MKKRSAFDEKKALYGENPVYISKLLDPYTVKIAKVMYNLGFTPNIITLLNLFLGLIGIAMMFLIKNFYGLLIAAILITLRNIGDTVDGKVARGGNMKTPIGGFLDLVSDWIIFHAFFFIAIGFLTEHIIVGFICVIGYMSREFTRRQFTKSYGSKITKTEVVKKMPLIVSLARKYDLASALWIWPFVLLVYPAFIIYATAIIEYVLLTGELALDIILLLKKKNKYIFNHTFT